LVINIISFIKVEVMILCVVDFEMLRAIILYILIFIGIVM
jgi:hypothetical protein